MTTPTQQQQRGYRSATAAAQAQLAQSFYQAQALLAAMATRDMLALWQQMDLRNVKDSWPALRTAIAGVVRDRWAMSVADGGQYYAQARTLAGVPPPAPTVTALPVSPTLAAQARVDEAMYEQAVAAARAARAAGLEPAEAPTPPAVSIPPPSAPLITATLDSTGPYNLLARIKMAQPLPMAAEAAGVRMSGAATRLVQNGARNAVIGLVEKDKEAVGWMRVLGVSKSGPCAFCSMLASRGAAFKTRASAGFKAHDNCKCTAAPVFSKETAEELADNDLYEQWKRVTRQYSGRGKYLAWRRYWDKLNNRDGLIVNPAA